MKCTGLYEKVWYGTGKQAMMCEDHLSSVRKFEVCMQTNDAAMEKEASDKKEPRRIYTAEELKGNFSQDPPWEAEEINVMGPNSGSWRTLSVTAAQIKSFGGKTVLREGPFSLGCYLYGSREIEGRQVACMHFPTLEAYMRRFPSRNWRAGAIVLYS